jgi:hypothetical protein
MQVRPHLQRNPLEIQRQLNQTDSLQGQDILPILAEREQIRGTLPHRLCKG